MPHGDYQGIGYEQLLNMLDDAETLDLCSITLYGSPRMVADNAADRLDEHIKVKVIDTPEAADDRQLNIIDCSPEGIDDANRSCLFADLGQPDNNSRRSAIITLAKAIADTRSGKADVVVSLPAGSGNVVEGKPHFFSFAYSRIFTEAAAETRMIYIDGDLKLMAATAAATPEEAAGQITAESLTDCIERMHHSLRRDFMVSVPRIAIVWSEGAEAAPLTEAIAAQASLGRAVYGPYPADIMADRAALAHFDAVIGMCPQQVLSALFGTENGRGDTAVAFLSGADVVCTAPAHNALYGTAGKDDPHVESLRNALYAAIGIRRCRDSYDEARQNPLPKLYHERREDGDRSRFGGKKPFDPAEQRHDKAGTRHDGDTTAHATSQDEAADMPAGGHEQ